MALFFHLAGIHFWLAGLLASFSYNRLIAGPPSQRHLGAQALALLNQYLTIPAALVAALTGLYLLGNTALLGGRLFITKLALSGAAVVYTAVVIVLNRRSAAVASVASDLAWLSVNQKVRAARSASLGLLTLAYLLGLVFFVS